MTDIIIGKYKIEDYYSFCTVHKSLGPWPLKNWSWGTFYEGTLDDCKSYVEWATRIDSHDQDLINHVADWYQTGTIPGSTFAKSKKFHETIFYYPKISHYNFKDALVKYPKKSHPEIGPEIVLLTFIMPLILLCAALYQMR